MRESCKGACSKLKCYGIGLQCQSCQSCQGGNKCSCGISWTLTDADVVAATLATSWRARGGSNLKCSDIDIKNVKVVMDLMYFLNSCWCASLLLQLRTPVLAITRRLLASSICFPFCTLNLEPWTTLQWAAGWMKLRNSKYTTQTHENIDKL